MARLELVRRLVRRWKRGRDAAWRQAVGESPPRLAMFARSTRVELTFAAGRLPGAPSSNRHVQMHGYLDRLDRTWAMLAKALGLTAADFPKAAKGTVAGAGGGGVTRGTGRLHCAILRQPAHVHGASVGAVGLVPQGVGVKRFGSDPMYVLRHDARRLPTDAAVHADVVHNAVHLWVAQMQPVGWIGERGFGWLDAGLAHCFTRRAVGRCATLCFHEASQGPLRFRSGMWRDAATQLLREGRLPRLAGVFDTDTAELTPEEHVASYVAVRYLIEVVGGHQVGAFLRAVKQGKDWRSAFVRVFGFASDALDARLQAWLRGQQTVLPLPSAASRLRPHVALYVYTRSTVRARHAAIVREAIEKRAKVHTSGFAIRDRRPVRELGPVNGNVRHWHGDSSHSKTPRAWPFAAVLEFAKRKGHRGYLDWFRRQRGSKDGGAWFLDPAGTYVEHINAEVVCGEDDRYYYVAVVDTPTGGIVGGSEFAVRGRVIDANGQTSVRGWWVRFSVRGAVASWREELLPLVSWRVTERDKRHGVRATGSVAEPARELAVFGTGTVFRFPPVQKGMRACGGR